MNHPVRPGRGKGYVPLAWSAYALVSAVMLTAVLAGCKSGEGTEKAPTPTVVRGPASDPCRCVIRPTLEVTEGTGG